MRTQTFQVGDVVTDLDGNAYIILEVFIDPHDPRFSHCGGTSARYTVRHPFAHTTHTRWDWQFTLAKAYNLAPKLPEKVSFLDALKKFFSR